MKCKNCGKKVFKNISDEEGRIGTFRICVNCGTIHDFSSDYRIKLQNDRNISKEVREKRRRERLEYYRTN